MPEELTLVGVVFWIVYSGGAGIAAWLAIDHVSFLKNLGSDYKRYAGLLLPGVIALAVWGVGLAMNYIEIPGDARDWIESAFSVALPAIVTAQTAHGVTVLRDKRLNKG